MTKDLELRLVAEFPDIFQDYGGDMRTTCMHWGFSHGDGWIQVLRDLCDRLETIRRRVGFMVGATQVKEKFGYLHFYYGYKIDPAFPPFTPEEIWAWRSVIQAIVAYAEGESGHTCEVCGRYGRIETGDDGWDRCRCDTHRGTYESGDPLPHDEEE